MAAADSRIPKFLHATTALERGQYDVEVPLHGTDEVAALGAALDRLARSLESRSEELNTLARITEQINAGLLLDEVLESVFESFRPLIPYNRIGLALLEADGATVRARWARSDAPSIEIGKGYAARIEGSSLQRILETREPRILNDLDGYLQEHPGSNSTRRIVREGMRSSLTCPLLAMGKPIGFIFFSSTQRDVYREAHTELFRQIASQLSIIIEKGRLYQEVVELNAVKDRFLGMVAHDLRNPISVVRMLVDLVLTGGAGPVNDDQREILSDVLAASGTMLTLVDDLLTASALESGQLILKRQDVAVAEYLRGVVSSQRLAACAKDIRLEVSGVVAGLRASIDPDRLRQVLVNLISNAIKFSERGSRITVSARAEATSVTFSVADQGQGIPQNEFQKLFKEFSRTSVASTAGETSTGLGLAITRRIVEAHGGRIWVESVVGEGSVFQFTVPCAG